MGDYLEAVVVIAVLPIGGEVATTSKAAHAREASTRGDGVQDHEAAGDRGKGERHAQPRDHSRRAQRVEREVAKAHSQQIAEKCKGS